MQRQVLRIAIASACLIGASTTAVLAQSSGIAGIVKDTTGAVLPGVTVETASPATFTLLLHADDKIEKRGPEFMIAAGGTKLLIDATIEDPKTLGQLQSRVEPNNLTAPGPPGAVDKGAQQVRGQKLVLTTAPTTKARIVERLTIE